MRVASPARRLIIALSVLMISAAAGAAQAAKSVSGFRLPADAKIMLAKPDVELSELAATVAAPKPDWSRDAADYLELHTKNRLKETPRAIIPFDRKDELEGRLSQVIRLNEQVAMSIFEYNKARIALPSKREFDWTLGEGAKELGAASGADYALFISAGGTFATAGRKVAMLGAAAFGVGIPLGQQAAFVWLVDLKTGQVVWFNTVLAGPRADMRREDGAGRLVEQLFKGFPF